MALAETLTKLGFKADSKAKQVAVDNAEAQELSANGDYVVHDVFTKGDVVVTVEQNSSPEDLGGLTAQITHPPVAIAVSPKGRVAFNPEDLELAAAIVADLA